ncbi:hypothetical protein [Alcaligenes faecalis]|nr:hypothetical protein [Alcaligenes faecalis]
MTSGALRVVCVSLSRTRALPVNSRGLDGGVVGDRVTVRLAFWLVTGLV